jgi:hypothetical protein
MVGQGPQLHTVAAGTLGQRFGCEGAVRDDRVAVEIGVE